MGGGIVIITATGADTKLVNRLLLTLRDWEFGNEDIWDHWRILRKKDDVPLPHDNGLVDKDNVDKPPIESFSPNEWEGMTMEEIEQLMVLKDGEGGNVPHLFVVLDEKGVQDETTIVVQKRLNADENGPLFLDRYNKVRVPWIQTHIMWCNLDIANMGFEEYCNDERGRDHGGWFVYQPIEPSGHYAEFLSRRDGVLNELKKLDLA